MGKRCKICLELMITLSGRAIRKLRKRSGICGDQRAPRMVLEDSNREVMLSILLDLLIPLLLVRNQLVSFVGCLIIAPKIVVDLLVNLVASIITLHMIARSVSLGILGLNCVPLK